jgi:aspartyl-tRNA(Asn)/glutamyl-tRNA(Gln) amidotransferase subunit C
MDITTVTRVAKLASLRFSDDEKQAMAGELSKIFHWIEQLQSVNVDGVEPLYSPGQLTLPLREDKVTDGHRRDEVLANAPIQEHGCFAVPKVIE